MLFIQGMETNTSTAAFICNPDGLSTTINADGTVCYWSSIRQQRCTVAADLIPLDELRTILQAARGERSQTRRRPCRSRGR